MRVFYEPGGGPGGRQGHRGRPRSDGGSGPTLDQIWPGYLEGGYFDENGYLKTEYVCREKVEPLVREMCVGPSGLTHTQVRRFFGHCRQLERALVVHNAAWEGVRPLVYKMDVASAEGVARGKLPKLFADFIKRNVAAVSTKHDFLDGFLPHFEALVGFGRAYFAS